MVEALIAAGQPESIGGWPLATMVVEEMDDGGMGSLSFVGYGRPDHGFGGAIAEGEFCDIDNVGVMIWLDLNEGGDLYELDVFKGDFSPLRRMPDPTDIILRRPLR